MITPLLQLMYNTLTFIYYNSVFIAVLMIKTQIKATEKSCLRIHNSSWDEEIIIIFFRLSFNLIKKDWMEEASCAYNNHDNHSHANEIFF